VGRRGRRRLGTATVPDHTASLICGNATRWNPVRRPHDVYSAYRASSHHEGAQLSGAACRVMRLGRRHMPDLRRGPLRFRLVCSPSPRWRLGLVDKPVPKGFRLRDEYELAGGVPGNAGLVSLCSVGEREAGVNNYAQHPGPGALNQVAAGGAPEFGAMVLSRSVAEQLDVGPRPVAGTRRSRQSGFGRPRALARRRGPRRYGRSRRRR